MRILGIDPGYGIIGFGVIESEFGKIRVVDYGAVTTPKEMSLPERLMIIQESFEKILEEYKPDEIAIEELFFFRNLTTVIPVAEARGVILTTCYKKCKNLFEYTPLQIKQALTGNGRAEKQQVQFMVKNVLGLGAVPKPDDTADALAVAICHSQINSALNVNRV
ncbi:MAG: crossover junction endodeoxyribonuclease RuvC [Clostridia bacterium]|nr:crossover junction endodeoxyribonuclease RuvC [Clostridia bacterium]